MKKRKNGAGMLPLVCVLLAALAFVCVSCTGTYYNRDMWTYSSGSSGGTDNPGSSKPAKLASGATLEEARAKLQQIIDYSGTSDGVRSLAEAMKLNLSGYNSSTWSMIGPTYISQINSWIDMI
jgi:hypothetical protein